MSENKTYWHLPLQELYNLSIEECSDKIDWLNDLLRWTDERVNPIVNVDINKLRTLTSAKQKEFLNYHNNKP